MKIIRSLYKCKQLCHFIIWFLFYFRLKSIVHTILYIRWNSISNFLYKHLEFCHFNFIFRYNNFCILSSLQSTYCTFPLPLEFVRTERIRHVRTSDILICYEKGTTLSEITVIWISIFTRSLNQNCRLSGAIKFYFLLFSKTLYLKITVKISVQFGGSSSQTMTSRCSDNELVKRRLQTFFYLNHNISESHTLLRTYIRPASISFFINFIFLFYFHLAHFLQIFYNFSSANSIIKTLK